MPAADALQSATAHRPDQGREGVSPFPQAVGCRASHKMADLPDALGRARAATSLLALVIILTWKAQTGLIGGELGYSLMMTLCIFLAVMLVPRVLGSRTSHWLPGSDAISDFLRGTDGLSVVEAVTIMLLSMSGHPAAVSCAPVE